MKSTFAKFAVSASTATATIGLRGTVATPPSLISVAIASCPPVAPQISLEPATVAPSTFASATPLVRTLILLPAVKEPSVSAEPRTIPTTAVEVATSVSALRT